LLEQLSQLIVMSFFNWQYSRLRNESSRPDLAADLNHQYPPGHAFGQCVQVREFISHSLAQAKVPVRIPLEPDPVIHTGKLRGVASSLTGTYPVHRASYLARSGAPDVAHDEITERAGRPSLPQIRNRGKIVSRFTKFSVKLPVAECPAL
jgi:hypothetical protein